MEVNPYAQLLITDNISYFIFKLQYLFWTSPEKKYVLHEYWIPYLMSQWWTEEGVVCCHLLFFRFFFFLPTLKESFQHEGKAAFDYSLL